MTRDSSPTTVILDQPDWRPPGANPAFTCTGMTFIAIMADGRTVLKYPRVNNEEGMEALRLEAARFDALGSHENLVTCIGMSEYGLLFEYCENRSLDDVLQDHGPLTTVQKMAFSKQIMHGLIFLHDQNFIHCDLKVTNIFVTSDMVAKIGDIQGQLYHPDGTIAMPTMSGEHWTARHPHAGEDEFTVRTDLFALGTLLYHLWYGHDLFPDLRHYVRQEREEIQARLQREEFPIDKSKATGMDSVISKCWHSEYQTAREVLSDMDKLDRE